MKKIMLFAAACLALAACSKDIDTTSPEIGDGSAFEKGQKVTLTVNTGDQTKVTSSLDGSTGAVDFKWETGDMIKVTVGTESATFTLSSGAGEATAEFTGTMPASGDKFNVQYPVTEPDLATQTYSPTEALPHDKMKFTATDCSVGTPFTLTAENAALRLNLYGYTNIGSIVVTTIEGTPKTYTLVCKGSGSTGTEPGKTDTPKPFFIVVPAETFGFTVSVKNVSGTEINSFSTSDKEFAPGTVLNMKSLGYPSTDKQPVKIGKTVWAPVNCGYEPATTSPAYKGYPYGKLYQWGRKDGQGYGSNDATYPLGDNLAAGPISNIPTSSDAEKFYKVTADPYNWYNGTSPAPNALWGATKTTYDPCPEGWRVPTQSELTALITTKVWTTTGGPSGNQTGYLFGTAPNQVFLPAAGCRPGSNGSARDRGNYGFYWSSSVGDDSAWYLYFRSGSAYNDGSYRANGYSVRCVQK